MIGKCRQNHQPNDQPSCKPAGLQQACGGWKGGGHVGHHEKKAAVM